MKEEQIKNYINENKRIWEANELTVEEIAERCLLDGEQLGVDRLNSTPRLLQILKDRGVIKSWYYNGSYHIGEVADLEKEIAELKDVANKLFDEWCRGEDPCPHLKKRDEQLTKAKALMKKLIANAPNTYSGTNIELQQKKMFSFQDAVNKAEQFIKESE